MSVLKVEAKNYSLYPHKFIGRITFNIGEVGKIGVATGGLVSPNLVITAAHVIFNKK